MTRPHVPPPTGRSLATLPADEHLHALRAVGMVQDTFAGVQFDLNAALRRVGTRFVDAFLCDHNCTTHAAGVPTGGQYDCPAALSLNGGVVKASLAPGALVLRAVDHAVRGLLRFRDEFLRGPFQAYSEHMRVPAHVGSAVANSLAAGNVEVTLFGGSPEIHPDFVWLCRELKARSYWVIATMTGRRLMKDRSIFAKVLESPPDVIALSADDFDDPAHVRMLAGLDLGELAKEWRRIPTAHGQRQKAYEAMYVARAAAGDGISSPSPELLFNIALHPGNLSFAGEMLDELSLAVPVALLNPFPVQTAFMDAAPAIRGQDLERVERFVDSVLSEHLSIAWGKRPRWNLAPRLHYWLMLKAVFVAYGGDPLRTAATLGGADLWRCYQSSAAGRYVQVSSPTAVRAVQGVAGGHLACFWNDTVTERMSPVWSMNVDRVVHYLSRGRGELALAASDPCKGCAFPRLVFDLVSLETGLSPLLRDAYLDLRKEYVGY